MFFETELTVYGNSIVVSVKGATTRADLLSNPSLVGTGDPNQAALGAAVVTSAFAAPQTLLSTGTTMADAVVALTDSDMLDFQGVHAEPYASYLTVRLEQLQHVSNLALDRAGGFRSMGLGLEAADEAPAGTRPNRNVWSDVGYLGGKVGASDGLDGFDYQITSVLVGADMFERGNLAGGLYAGYGYSQMELQSGYHQELETDSFLIGAYGRYDFDTGWVLSAVAGYSYDRNSSERGNADIGLFSGGLATADFDSNDVNAGLRLHRDFAFADGWNITPFVGLSYSYIRQDTVTETGGGDFNYTIHAASADALVSTVGARIRRTFEVNQALVTPVLFLQYDYDWSADDNAAHEITVSNPVFGTFNQVGQDQGPSGFVLGGGLEVELAKGISLAGSYAYSWYENGYTQSGRAKLAWVW